MVIFVRDFYPKRKEDLVVVFFCESAVQREKEKIRPPPEKNNHLLSFHAEVSLL